MYIILKKYLIVIVLWMRKFNVKHLKIFLNLDWKLFFHDNYTASLIFSINQCIGYYYHHITNCETTVKLVIEVCKNSTIELS